jgi:hypothetical protein
LKLIILVCWLHGAYPEITANIVLSEDDDDAKVARPLGQTDSAGRVEPSTGCVSAVNDFEALRKASETDNPKLIVASASGSIVPPDTDRVQTAPALGARGRKWPHIAAKRSDQGRRAAHVITQIELLLTVDLRTRWL